MEEMQGSGDQRDVKTKKNENLSSDEMTERGVNEGQRKREREVTEKKRR